MMDAWYCGRRRSLSKYILICRFQVRFWKSLQLLSGIWWGFNYFAFRSLVYLRGKIVGGNVCRIRYLQRHVSKLAVEDHNRWSKLKQKSSKRFFSFILSWPPEAVFHFFSTWCHPGLIARRRHFRELSSSKWDVSNIGSLEFLWKRRQYFRELNFFVNASAFLGTFGELVGNLLTK